MRLLINYEISKSYPEWRAVFDAHKSSRDEANVKDVFVGVEAANPQKVHLMFEVEDMEAMQALHAAPRECSNYRTIWPYRGVDCDGSLSRFNLSVPQNPTVGDRR